MSDGYIGSYILMPQTLAFLLTDAGQVVYANVKLQILLNLLNRTRGKAKSFCCRRS